MSSFTVCSPKISQAAATRLMYIIAAAQRAPDKVEADADGSRALNVTSSASLARQTSPRQIFLLYISTDYVFPGAPGEAPYSAACTPGPTNLYGQMKLDGERAVIDEASPGMGVVLRVPVLYGPVSGEGKEGRKESAVNTLLDKVYEAQEKEVIMDDWSQRYPTCTEDVGRVCKDISHLYTSKLSASAGAHDQAAPLPRLLQFSAEERMTKYRMCEIFADILGLPMGQMKANREGNDPGATVQRPYDTHLSTEELKRQGISVLCQTFEAWWRKETGAYKK